MAPKTPQRSETRVVANVANDKAWGGWFSFEDEVATSTRCSSFFAFKVVVSLAKTYRAKRRYGCKKSVHWMETSGIALDMFETQEPEGIDVDDLIHNAVDGNKICR